ncbi:MAG: hypothetical protein EXS50_01185 [Candidatus Taylorbacteria bacterium]|nr:hypothetical protein [Candidatus Taylorbacteria bacterium]
MLEFKEKRKRRKILSSPWLTALLLIIFIFGIQAVWKIYQKEQMSRSNLEQANRELTRLKVRYDTLTSGVNRLKTPAGVEEEIRNKFSVIKEGEQVAIIIDSVTVATSTPIAPSPKSFWQKFLDLF